MGASALEKLLMGSGNFENQNFENHADEINNLSAGAKQAIVQANTGMINHIGGVVKSSTWDSLVINSKGDLNITVTRESANIASVLPFVLFGANDFQAGYVTTLQGLIIPASMGACVVTTAVNGDILFTYTLGGNVDVVRVKNLGNVSMRAFLAGMNNNYFKTSNFLLSISDEAYNQLQFGQTLFFGQLSALGLTGANQLIFRSRTNSWMFRKDRVEVLVPEQKIVPEYSFAMSIIAVANFNIGFDFFMSERMNLNNTQR